MGVPCQKKLILELMGRNSNLILTGADGRILDCLRRVDFEMSEQRQVLPGLFTAIHPGRTSTSRRRRTKYSFSRSYVRPSLPAGWTSGCWTPLRAFRR